MSSRSVSLDDLAVAAERSILHPMWSHHPTIEGTCEGFEHSRLVRRDLSLRLYFAAQDKCEVGVSEAEREQ